MPRVRKIREEEFYHSSKRLSAAQRLKMSYDRFIADFQPGDKGEVLAGEGEQRRTVQNRLKAAARRHKPPYVLVFRHFRGEGAINFVVLPDDSPDGGKQHSSSERWQERLRKAQLQRRKSRPRRSSR
ncbi:MAG: hypothetical protein RLZZ387_3749 [Chloroflexota bacterium]|jgi:hypothetical protein